MDVSVVLCTYNRCKLLPLALESVAASVMPPGIHWEVVVVDNNSKDQTRAVIEEFCRRFPSCFRYLFEARPGKSYALNAGIDAANGTALAFMDDDVTVDPEWLANITAPILKQKDIAGTGGRVVPSWMTSRPRWLKDDGWAIAGPLVAFDRGDVGCTLEESPVGTNMAFPKRVFERYGGFRVDLGPSPHNEIRNEDSEFARRIFRGGERMNYVPNAIVYHPVTEDRLTKKYFQAWWFDKGRSEIRESGIPTDSGVRICSVPIPMFRRLTRWLVQWMATPNAPARFECKLRAWYTAGVIRECLCHLKTSKASPKIAAGNGSV